MMVFDDAQELPVKLKGDSLTEVVDVNHGCFILLPPEIRADYTAHRSVVK
jgi:hypothetical protein